MILHHTRPHHPSSMLLVTALAAAGCTSPNPMIGSFDTSPGASASDTAGEDTGDTDGTDGSGTGSTGGDSDGPSTGSTGGGAMGVCGDGTLDPGEACDDGNTVDGDGCQADCTLPMAACGDGNADPGESCHALGTPAMLGGEAVALAAGDLDGDGSDEIVAAVPSISRIVRVDHDGTTPTAVDDFFAGVKTWVVALADLDGDFKLDAVTAGDSPPKVYLVPGDGAGSFATPEEMPTSIDALGAVQALRVTQLDADGRPDLLLSSGLWIPPNIGSVNLRYLLGQPGPAWDDASTISAGTFPPVLLDSVDILGGDGLMEVIVAGLDRVQLQLPSGAGEFATNLYMEWTMPADIAAATLADVDDDGRDEVLVALEGLPVLRVLDIDDQGNLAPDPVDITLASAATRVVRADLDGDGRDDLAVGLEGGDLTLLLQGDGGTLTELDTLAVGSEVSDMVATDLNGDGQDDLALAVATSDELAFLLSNP